VEAEAEEVPKPAPDDVRSSVEDCEGLAPENDFKVAVEAEKGKVIRTKAKQRLWGNSVLVDDDVWKLLEEALQNHIS
jgi:hypothetical protein